MEKNKDDFFKSLWKIFEKRLTEILKPIAEKLNSEFEKECLMHYLLKGGETLIVSDDVFKRIAEEAVKEQEKAGGKLQGATPVKINGKQYYSKCISFYNNDEFDYALGCATVFFDESGTPVGLRDYYDFDPAEHPGDMEEKLTQIMAELEKTPFGGKPYDILYGIYIYILK